MFFFLNVVHQSEYVYSYSGHEVNNSAICEPCAVPYQLNKMSMLQISLKGVHMSRIVEQCIIILL